MSVRCVCTSSRAFLVPRVSSSFSERSPSSPSLTALATLDAARVSSRAAVRAQTAATLAKLKSLWVSGEVGPDTPVWTEGMPERTRVRDVPSLLGCLPGASLASPRAALLSDDLRWEPGGHRHRAAALCWCAPRGSAEAYVSHGPRNGERARSVMATPRRTRRVHRRPLRPPEADQLRCWSDRACALSAHCSQS